MTKEERAQYRHEWKIYNDYFNCLDTAKEQGLEKGRAEGRAEGIKETVQKLKELGLSVEQIMMATGLSQTEIEKL